MMRRLDWRNLAIVAVFLAAVVGMLIAAMPIIQKTFGRPEREGGASPGRADPPPAELARDEDGRVLQPPRLRVSSKVAKAFGLDGHAVARAEPATAPRELPSQIGTLAYDNERLAAVRSRFPGEIAEITRVAKLDAPDAPDALPLPSAGHADNNGLRPLAVGDRIKEGDILAVVWSKDLGEKKGALVDAVIDLHLEEERLKRYAQAFQEGGYSEGAYRDQENRVQRAKNAVLTAERTLKFWRLEPDEIEAIKKEANRLSLQAQKRDPEQEKAWARVEIKASQAGVIVEKNTNLGDMVDPSRETPLFRIADLSTLQIWVHLPEEYLPLLRASTSVHALCPFSQGQIVRFCS